MAYYYYEYYSFSYFFLFFLFFFLLILILFPNYTKKDIVPPLSDANYAILPTSVGTLSITDIKSSTFRDLTIQDGERSNTDAIDFGGDGGDQLGVELRGGADEVVGAACEGAVLPHSVLVYVGLRSNQEIDSLIHGLMDRVFMDQYL